MNDREKLKYLTTLEETKENMDNLKLYKCSTDKFDKLMKTVSATKTVYSYEPLH